MKQRFRVLTLNIAHGRGLSTYQGFCGERRIERNLLRIARLFRELSPDLVAMQEVDEDSHWNKRIHLLDFLKIQADFPHSHLGVNNRRQGRLPLAYGNGVLSRYAIEHATNCPFGEAALGEKGFLYTELALPDAHLPVVNLHLDYKSRIRRIEQIERLIGYLEARHRERGGAGYLSPLVCGDFNSRSGRPNDAVRHLFDYLKEQCAYQLYPLRGATFPSIMPLHGLDFILVPPTYRVLHCEILKSYVSDHRPVLIDLEIVD